MSIFMSVVKQVHDLGLRGRVRFEIDLSKWAPGRAKQAQPADVWTVTYLDGSCAFEVETGPEAIDALVQLVAAIMRRTKT